MSLISRYILKLHLVPFVFALSALTGIMMVNQIAKRLNDLLGKGLPWHVIVEVFVLSVPFIVAMTLPMAVLVAVLYTMSRLTGDNELTALRASGVSVGYITRPLVLAGVGVAIVAFAFSDQVLPRSNHRLRTLLTAITRTKPTFGLEEQVVNEVQRSRLFLRAGRVDDNRYTLRDVTILDLSDHNRKRVTYADSAHMVFAANEEDLILTLFEGSSHETDRVNAENFQLADFRRDRVRVEGVANNFTRSINDTFKGDREMGICEMDSVVTTAREERWVSLRRAEGVEVNSLRGIVGLAPIGVDTVPPAAARQPYCAVVDRVKSWLQPAELEAQTPQEAPGAGAVSTEELLRPFNEPARRALSAGAPPRVSTAKVLMDRAGDAEIRAANYLVEIHKKYAIAAACIVFVLVGVPTAIRFPRGGVGLVVGISLSVFTVYYVGLIAGESVANKLIVSPFWAMWTPNIIFAIVGTVALWRISAEATTRGRRTWTLPALRRRPAPSA